MFYYFAAMIRMRKFLLLIAIAFGRALADESAKVLLEDGVEVYSLESSFDNVYVEDSAVSAKTKCAIRIDIQNRLVDVDDCNVNRINFYTKDDMWLGDISRSSEEDEPNFDANYSYQDVKLRFDLTVAAYFRVDFAYATKFATPGSLWMVSCPEGLTKAIDGQGYGICLQPYQCGLEEYAVDKFSCAALPRNAVRLREDGFVCDGDFGWNVYEGYCDGSYSKCSEGAVLSRDGRLCTEIPENSRKVSETNWLCNEGYVAKDGYCNEIPENAYAVNANSWACNDGFAEQDGVCKPRVACTVSQYNVSEFECADVPLHAHKIYYGDVPWACNEGFLEYDGSCRKIAVCSETQYYINEFTCGFLPENSHRAYGSGDFWECDEGFIERDGNCEVVVPVSTPAYITNTETETPWVLPGNLSMEFAVLVGFPSVVLGDPDDDMVIAEFELGGEWLFGSAYILGPAATIVGVIDNRYDDAFLFNARLKLSLVMGLGVNDAYWYVRPFISINLGTSVDFDGRDTSDYLDVPAAVGGMELGFRFGNSAGNNMAMDVFLSAAPIMIRDKYFENDIVYSLGVRFVAF